MNAGDLLRALAEAINERDRVGAFGKDYRARFQKANDEKLAAEDEHARSELLNRVTQQGYDIKAQDRAAQIKAAMGITGETDPEAALGALGQRTTLADLSKAEGDAKAIGLANDITSQTGLEAALAGIAGTKATTAHSQAATAGEEESTRLTRTKRGRIERGLPPEPSSNIGILTPLVDGQGRVIGTFNNKTGEVGLPHSAGGPIVPGQPATVGGVDVRKSPLPAQIQQSAGIAQTVKDNIATMDTLADKVVAGPGTGHLSKLSQSVMGPHGDEGDFDFLGNAVVDLVYIKSGKQINENEMAILRQMIPNRARGNLKQQVKLFGDYANGLLRQYGVSEDAAPTGGTPNAGGFKVLSVRPK